MRLIAVCPSEFPQLILRRPSSIFWNLRHVSTAIASFLLVLACALGIQAAEGIAVPRSRPHPNSQDACDVAGEVPERFRVAGHPSLDVSGVVSTIPPSPGPGRILVVDKGRELLLVGDRTIALVSAPITARGGGALRGVTSRSFGGDLLRDPGGGRPGPAWKICLGTARTLVESCSPEGVWINNEDLQVARTQIESATGSVVRLTWTSATSGVEVIQDISLIGRSLKVRLSAKSESANRGIVAARFPYINIDYGRDDPESGELIVPRENLGIKCRDCPGWQVVYPNLYQTMPWFGVLRGVHGLYLGAHDPTGAMKTVFAAGPASAGTSFFEIYPESSGDPGNRLDPKWDFEIAPICAKRGWPAIAHFYKEWASQMTTWGRAPLLTERADIPRDIRDGAWWFNHSIARDAGVDVLFERTKNNQLELNGFATVHHWYEWHEPGMDRGAPVHNPKAGTKDAIRKIQENPQSRVLLYTVVTHSDQSSAPIKSGRPWRCESSASQFPDYWEDTTRRADGSRIFTVLGTGTCFAWMDLMSDRWRAVVLSNSDLVTQRLGAKGVYLDVVGNIIEGSWSGAHHAPGRGAWVTASARDLVAEVSTRPELVVVEGALEQMTGISDAGVNYLGTPVDMIPIFPLVYHERYILAGLRSLPPDDRDALRVKNGLAFAWGLQPGLNSLQWHTPDRAANVDWARKLIEARIELKNWLAYGEYMGPVDQVPGGPLNTTRIRSWSPLIGSAAPQVFTRPQVEASLYRGADGVDSVILINLSDRPAILRLILPRPFEADAMVLYSSSGRRIAQSVIEPRMGIVEVSVPAAGIIRGELVEPLGGVGSIR